MQSEFTEKSIKLLASVREDIIVLKENYAEYAKNNLIKALAINLRKLLIEDHINIAANKLNYRFLIDAPFVDKNISFLGLGFYQNPLAVKSEGMQVYHVSESGGYNGMLPSPINKALSLKDFKNNLAFVVNGVNLSNEDVMKYVFYSEGSIHRDKESPKVPKQNLNRDKKQAALEQTRNYITANRPVLYTQLLGIGQMLAFSSASDDLIALINNVLGEECKGARFDLKVI